MLRAIALPAFQDNYIWLLGGPDGAVVVVDPGDDAPVQALQAQLDAAEVDIGRARAGHRPTLDMVLRGVRGRLICEGPDLDRVIDDIAIGAMEPLAAVGMLLPSGVTYVAGGGPSQGASTRTS